MASYAYTARDKTGHIQQGTVFATDQPAASANLLDKGLTPILIKPETVKTSGGIQLGKLHIGFGNKVKLQDKVVFSRQFATMINAGVPITQSLAILHQQATSKKFATAIAATGKKVEG